MQSPRDPMPGGFGLVDVGLIDGIHGALHRGAAR
jgi:hypothetical protein